MRDETVGRASRGAAAGVSAHAVPTHAELRRAASRRDGATGRAPRRARLGGRLGGEVPQDHAAMFARLGGEDVRRRRRDSRAERVRGERGDGEDDAGHASVSNRGAVSATHASRRGGLERRRAPPAAPKEGHAFGGVVYAFERRRRRRRRPARVLRDDRRDGGRRTENKNGGRRTETPRSRRALSGHLAVRRRGLHGPRHHLEGHRGRRSDLRRRTVRRVRRRRDARGLRQSAGEPRRGGVSGRLVRQARHGAHHAPHGRYRAPREHTQRRVRAHNAFCAVRPVQTVSRSLVVPGGAGGAPRRRRARKRHRQRVPRRAPSVGERHARGGHRGGRARVAPDAAAREAGRARVRARVRRALLQGHHPEVEHPGQAAQPAAAASGGDVRRRVRAEPLRVGAGQRAAR